MKKNFTLFFVGILSHFALAQSPFFFNVHSPLSIYNTYEAGQYGTVATGWGWDGTISTPIVADAVYAPEDAGTGLHQLCDSVSIPDFTGKIVVIDRGSCEFGRKALTAQNNGAVGVVIVNNVPDAVISLGAGSLGSQVTIPIIMVSQGVGQGIIFELQLGNTVVLSFANEPINLVKVKGNVIYDENENCLADNGEIGLGGWQIQAAIGNGMRFTTSKPDGSYVLYVPVGGTSTISVNPPANFWVPCANDFPVNFNQPDSTTINFEVKALMECPQMTVDIEVPFLRRCFDNYYDIDYCNLGSETAEDAYITVQFDDLLTIISSSSPYTDLGNNTYQFDLGDVAIVQCGHIDVTANLSCDATFEQTICAVAEAFPDTRCSQPNALWSGADLRISNDCVGGSVNFKIENRGDGNMSGPLNYTLLKDGQYAGSESFQLEAGTTRIYSFAADGSTYRMEAAQEPNHPSQTLVASTIEGCTTNGFFTTGIFSMFAIGDYGESYDEECMPVIGSYDPNDKTGYPLGYGPKHYIEQGTDLQYLIRFQNTGTDTAFNIVVRDTINTDVLDLSSIRLGTSSHPYSFSIENDRVMVFRFNQIMLPDSFINEPMSHGYLNFYIQQKPSLPLGTLIENSAAIYFDFNEPVITNTYFHEIGENFINSATTQVFLPGLEVAVAPNPMGESTAFDLGDLKFKQGQLELYDATGKLLRKQGFDTPRFVLNRNGLPSGNLIFKLSVEGRLAATGKLMLK